MKKLTILAALFASTPLYAQIDQPAPPQAEQWTELQGNVKVEGDHQVVPIDPVAGEIRRIRIEAQQGSPFVTQVMIRFEDGRRELWGVGQKLAPGNAFELEISRKHQRVESVIIFADPHQPGSYRVMTET